MIKMELKDLAFLGSPNFYKGRNEHEIKGIIIHWMAGKFDPSIKWMRDPKSKASAHYCINENGHTISMVLPENRAWHAGVSEMKGYGKDCNNYTIGIELEGPPSMTGNNKWPAAQIDELIWLCQELIKAYPTIEFITDHSHVSPGRKIDVRGSTGKAQDIFPWDIFASKFQNIKIY